MAVAGANALIHFPKNPRVDPSSSESKSVDASAKPSIQGPQPEFKCLISMTNEELVERAGPPMRQVQADLKAYTLESVTPEAQGYGRQPESMLASKRNREQAYEASLSRAETLCGKHGPFGQVRTEVVQNVSTAGLDSFQVVGLPPPNVVELGGWLNHCDLQDGDNCLIAADSRPGGGHCVPVGRSAASEEFAALLAPTYGYVCKTLLDAEYMQGEKVTTRATSEPTVHASMVTPYFVRNVPVLFRQGPGLSYGAIYETGGEKFTLDNALTPAEKMPVINFLCASVADLRGDFNDPKTSKYMDAVYGKEEIYDYFLTLSHAFQLINAQPEREGQTPGANKKVHHFVPMGAGYFRHPFTVVVFLNVVLSRLCQIDIRMHGLGRGEALRLAKEFADEFLSSLFPTGHETRSMAEIADSAIDYIAKKSDKSDPSSEHWRINAKGVGRVDAKQVAGTADKGQVSERKRRRNPDDAAKSDEVGAGGSPKKSRRKEDPAETISPQPEVVAVPDNSQSDPMQVTPQ